MEITRCAKFLLITAFHSWIAGRTQAFTPPAAAATRTRIGSTTNTSTITCSSAFYAPRLCFRLHQSDSQTNEQDFESDDVDVDVNIDTGDDIESFQQRQILKLSLLFQAQGTKRGFQATSSEREEISSIISQLAALNPTSQPAAAYYATNTRPTSTDSGTDTETETGTNNMISGKWTLQYTNAPDITSLDPTLSNNDGGILNLIPAPPPLSKLARIGQECDAIAGTITNIIEWRQPDWFSQAISGIDIDTEANSNSGARTENKDARAVPSSSSGPRVLQKIICEATADPSRPFQVDLQLAGFELVGETETDTEEGEGEGESSQSSSNNPSILNPFGFPLPNLNMLKEGPAALLKKNPVKLRGPLKAPFGKFEILYLDEDMRIIQTGQGYFAVNVRGETWF